MHCVRVYDAVAVVVRFYLCLDTAVDATDEGITVRFTRTSQNTLQLAWKTDKTLPCKTEAQKDNLICLPHHITSQPPLGIQSLHASNTSVERKEG
jgi:hypothetical protein